MAVYSVRDLFGVPGLLSLARLPLAVVFVATLGNAHWSLAVLLLAALSDVLDGWYARRFGKATRTGAVLDAVMDKTFVLTVVVALVLSHGLTVAQALLLGVRDVGELAIGASLAAGGANRLSRAHPPHALGKLTTLLQYAAVASAVVASRYVALLSIAVGVSGVLATIVYWLHERAAAPTLEERSAHR